MSAKSFLRFACDLCNTYEEVEEPTFTRPALPEGWYEVRPADPSVASLHCCGDCWQRARDASEPSRIATVSPTAGDRWQVVW